MYLICCLFVQNKYVFGYLSLLVQHQHFKVVEVFFLIVGHTHASIDQYFSILSRLIYYSAFIGSPLALAALLAAEKKGSKETSSITSAPLLVRKIRIVYDMKSAMDPFLNQLSGYQIPHRFVILSTFILYSFDILCML